MAPSNMDYHNESEVSESYTHKKFKTSAYTHKKFGKKSGKELAPTPVATPLFRPYALSENTPRKRRQETEREIQQQQQQQFHHHSLPPTPPTTPPQQQYQQYHSGTLPATQIPMTQLPAAQHTHITHSPVFNHQAYAYMLQKQRAVLQMRQLLSINPDANTWPLEWKQALQALLQK
ncbi:probable serine/threonine-protein kinase MARK-A [Drosophila gunungcola]|uniref:probable serine/threonine-protein kinase MARK-A n=1 Tax=Drosophila gunungcola TaxID=103775 RepID=UPI0022E1FF56|nr:probable serine/threonine-protein kinase MARK-A [Drosophila gunungcola]